MKTRLIGTSITIRPDQKEYFDMYYKKTKISLSELSRILLDYFIALEVEKEESNDN